MEIKGEELINKNKKTPIYIWLGYIICMIIIIVSSFSMDKKEQTQTPEAINFKDASTKTEEDKYAYLDVQGLSDEVAIYGNTDNKNDSSNDRYYIAISGGYYYVVDLNFETIEKLKEIQEYTYSTDENAVSPNPVKIYGMTEKIPDELKQLIIDFYNEGIEEEHKISIDDFNEGFGSVLLNVRKKPIDTNTEETFIILAVLGIFGIFIAQIILKLSKNKIQKYINKNGYKDEVINQLNNCIEEKHYKDKVILTKDFLVDLKSSTGAIFKYSDVKWAHIHNVKYYGAITVSSSIIAHLRDGKTQMKCVEIRGGTTDEFLEIFNKICEKTPADCLKGYTKENIQEFKQYRKEIKQNTL